MGFFEREPVNKNYTEQDLTNAKEIIRALQQAGRLIPGISSKYSHWARLLHKAGRRDPERLQEVIDWFVNHAKDRYTPHVRSATAFIDKLPQIEHAMQRHRKHNVEVTPLVVKLVKKLLLSKHWPKGSDAKVGVVVQSSWDNYVVFQRKFWELRDQYDTDEPTMGMLLYHLDQVKFQHPPETFVREWMIEVNESICEWAGWNGDLVSQGFRMDSPKFEQMGQRLVYEYCGDSVRWLRIMEALK